VVLSIPMFTRPTNPPVFSTVVCSRESQTEEPNYFAHRRIDTQPWVWCPCIGTRPRDDLDTHEVGSRPRHF